MTPGGVNNRRPDRATIVYTNLIRQYFKSTKPIILGGLEASLRRISHYDYWNDAVRRSVLFDAKADALIYGMGERTILELADAIKSNANYQSIRGLCYISTEKPSEYIELPSYEEVKESKSKFVEMFLEFYANNDPLNAKGLVQQHGNRYLIQNPPSLYLTQEELDSVYALDFERDVHPYYKQQGKVKALETVQFSITSHRGCFGECNFCSITVHQGRTILSRSHDSIINEAKQIARHKQFKGYISDLGGPTANMYGMACNQQQSIGSCKKKKCAIPHLCKNMNLAHNQQVELLKELRKIEGIKKIFVSSGIRFDLVMADSQNGKNYINEIARFHTSGQLKLAPEHIVPRVLKAMGKPVDDSLLQYRELFNKYSKAAEKKQFLTYYFIAAHPGCEQRDMLELNEFIHDKLALNPEQVQIFTPTPSTISTLMYYTGIEPMNNRDIFSEKDMRKKELQKNEIISKRNSKK